jgi:uncharacterized LabA/DUF88 family protein
LVLSPPAYGKPNAGVFIFLRLAAVSQRVDRAVFFVDGNNFYHGCEKLPLFNLGRLNFARVCMKLVGPRQWTATRYYVGQVPRTGNLHLSAEQKKFFSFLTSCDSRISVHLGRIEPRRAKSDAARELGRYLAGLRVRIDRSVYRDLVAISQKYAVTTVMVEKAVDVKIAIDMVVMAERDEYDTAYLLSADGDLTPAVGAVRIAEKGLRSQRTKRRATRRGL